MSTLTKATFFLTLLCGMLVTVSMVSAASAVESLRTDKPLAHLYRVESDETGRISIKIRLPDITLQSFRDKDAGEPKLVGAIMDPTNRRYAYLSVRIDLSKDATGPFISKIYRYDLETQRITRIYRETGASGYLLLGFDGVQLLMMEAASGDNSPGLCWAEEELAKGEKIVFLDARTPWTGLQKFRASASFKEMRKKALEACSVK